MFSSHETRQKNRLHVTSPPKAFFPAETPNGGPEEILGRHSFYRAPVAYTTPGAFNAPAELRGVPKYPFHSPVPKISGLSPQDQPRLQRRGQSRCDGKHSHAVDMRPAPGRAVGTGVHEPVRRALLRARHIHGVRSVRKTVAVARSGHELHKQLLGLNPAGQDADLFTRLPDAAGVGVALQMTDGTTRVLRMSEALERHLRQEWTPYLLANAADIKGEEVLRVLLYQDSKAVPMISLLEKSLGDRTAVLLGERAAADTLILTPRTVSGHEMLDAVCMPVGINPEDVLVLAGGMSMLELVRNASQSVAAADAPPELRLAAQKVTLTDAAAGSAVEVLYRMVRDAENLA